MHIRNTSYIPPNLEDIRIADMNELSEISSEFQEVEYKYTVYDWLGDYE